MLSALKYPSDVNEQGRILRKIGSIICKNKGLTLDDASEKVQTRLAGDPKELQDMYIGWEYFNKIQSKQRRRILDKDVRHIGYIKPELNEDAVAPIIKDIKARESAIASKIKNNSKQ